MLTFMKNIDFIFIALILIKMFTLNNMYFAQVEINY